MVGNIDFINTASAIRERHRNVAISGSIGTIVELMLNLCWFFVESKSLLSMKIVSKKEGVRTTIGEEGTRARGSGST
jgi:hypothetical protein